MHRERGDLGGSLAEAGAAANRDTDQEGGERSGHSLDLVRRVTGEVQQRMDGVVIKGDVVDAELLSNRGEPLVEVHDRSPCCQASVHGGQDDAMGRVTRRRPVLRIQRGPEPGSVRRQDTLAVEEPLEIRLNGESFVVTMRTPGDDLDLVHGLLHAEGIIAAVADITLARYCAGADEEGVNSYNVLDVTLAPSIVVDPEARRSALTSSACGVCGAASIDQVRRSSRYGYDPATRFAADTIVAAPELLREQQKAFSKTGGLHGAGLVTSSGELLCAREDVGRHNAVDKVIGWALRAGRLPLADCLLVVSARASFELTQKAVLAGIPVLAAVSAPSSLAVELGEEAGITVCGFVRGQTMNVYSHPERVTT